MTAFLTAPTERPPVANLGPKSSLPESLGVDVLWESRYGLCGLQRKEQSDLIASVRDGRLGKELEQMKQLKMAFVCIEGTPSWDREGNLQTQHTKWTLRHQWGVTLSIETKGFPVVATRNQLETCSLIEYLAGWTDREEHVSSLLARPVSVRNGWGKMDTEAFAIGVMTTLPDINTVLAKRLWDHFGKCILGLTVTEEELLAVKGIGKKTASDIIKACGMQT